MHLWMCVLRPNWLGPYSSHSSHQTASEDGGEVGGWRGEATNGFKVPQFSGLALEFSGNEIRGREGRWPCVMVADRESRFLDSRSFICKPTTSYCKHQNTLVVGGCSGGENSPSERVISQGIWEVSWSGPDGGFGARGAGGKGFLG